MTPETVTCDTDVTVVAEGPLRHLCPYKDEHDLGTAQISWVTAGRTFELHSLRAFLDTYAATRISHEAITDELRRVLAAFPGVANVQVMTRWDTAGFAVSVRGGEDDPLLREPLNRPGA